MKAPATRRFRRTSAPRHRESGITMVLVAIAMVAIIAMAALSIDVVTLLSPSILQERRFNALPMPLPSEPRGCSHSAE